MKLQKNALRKTLLTFIVLPLLSFLLLSLLSAGQAQAQSAPRAGSKVGNKVGPKAAAKYLSKDPQDSEEGSERRRLSDHMLMILVGPYTDSAAYAWKGSDKRTGIGSATYGVTYLFDQWNAIDVNFRGEFSEFKIDDERLLKLSLMPLWTFPMWESRFPLYFGLGAGLGVFFKQIENESNLSFDYQLVAGVRIPDLLSNAGFVVEFGLKNHLHLLSDGQFNGTALTVGTVFSF